MLPALKAVLKWLLFQLLPIYIILLLVVGGFTAAALHSLSAALELWPFFAILCVPAAGMMAASMAITPPHDRHGLKRW